MPSEWGERSGVAHELYMCGSVVSTVVEVITSVVFQAVPSGDTPCTYVVGDPLTPQPPCLATLRPPSPQGQGDYILSQRSHAIFPRATNVRGGVLLRCVCSAAYPPAKRRREID